MPKLRATKIVLNRAEGPSTECVEKVFSGDFLWNEANDQLKTWAQTAPERSYDKVDFTVYFSDGSTYDGRFDLKKEHSKTADLAQFIRKEIDFYSGKYKPEWMSEQKYKLALADFGKETMDLYLAFDQSYQIGD